jgi:hypothetical protein
VGSLGNKAVSTGARGGPLCERVFFVFEVCFGTEDVAIETDHGCVGALCSDGGEEYATGTRLVAVAAAMVCWLTPNRLDVAMTCLLGQNENVMTLPTICIQEFGNTRLRGTSFHPCESVAAARHRRSPSWRQRRAVDVRTSCDVEHEPWAVRFS